ncbi:MAG: rRNA pseudouridine synthase [Gemmataceae bacterium]
MTQQGVRLNRYLAQAGYGARRKVEELVRAGRVSVDGRVVKDLAYKVQAGQQVEVDGEPVRPQRLVYWAVNKPRGYVCTHYDPAGRPRIVDLLLHVPERIYPVGRLDEESEGLVILTNDGALAHRLMHPRYGVEKTYLAQVAGLPSREVLHKLVQGVWLSEGKARAKRVRRLGRKGLSTFLEIVLAEGKKREVRRMLARLGHKVMHLQRLAIGPVRLGRLKPGRCRPLSTQEIKALRALVGLDADGARRRPGSTPATGRTGKQKP